MAVVLSTTPLLRIQLDHGINAHNRHARFNRTLQLLHLAHARLQHARLQAVVHLAVYQVQAVVLVVLGSRKLLGVLGSGRIRGCALRKGMSGAQVRDKLGSVFCGVYGEGFGDGEERSCEGGDGELFAGALQIELDLVQGQYCNG